jgi:hypothetical protein
VSTEAARFRVSRSGGGLVARDREYGPLLFEVCGVSRLKGPASTVLGFREMRLIESPGGMSFDFADMTTFRNSTI